MCTAITYQTQDFYFGRTLDLDESYREEVTVTPRNFPLVFGEPGILEHHHAIIGMATVQDGYPLYYDGVNEKGLAMAGLNFVGYANYGKSLPGKTNVASYAFIPWVLANFSSVAEAGEAMAHLQLTDAAFRDDLPPAQLHWLLSDTDASVTIEFGPEGLEIYPNPVGVLTNNPRFPDHIFQLNNYMHLSPRQPKNQFSEKLRLEHYSNGMGSIGLPGDLSSQSRFIRAAFTKLNSISRTEEEASVGQFFHILESVSQVNGCCITEEGTPERTVYTSCCNTDKGIYYYTTYENRRITAVNMHREDLDSTFLIRYPLRLTQDIRMEN